MSYYAANYYRNPVPYLDSDIGEPVPGWGVNPLVAGPPMVGVGQEPKKFAVSPATLQRLTPITQAGPTGPAPPSPEDEITPWWVYPAVAAVGLGIVGYVGTRQGWL